MSAQDELPREFRTRLAFGFPLREGIELCRLRGAGLTAVLGCGSCHRKDSSTGEPAEQAVSPMTVLRAAEAGNAVILNADWDRIVREQFVLDEPLPGSERSDAAAGFAVRSGHPVVTVDAEQRTASLLVGERRYPLRSRAELRNEADDLLNALRLLRATQDDPGATDTALAHRMVDDLGEHFVELGEFGDDLRLEAVRLAISLGIRRPLDTALSTPGVSPESGHRDEPGCSRHVSEVRNESSGVAHNMIQAGSIRSVVVNPAPLPVPAPRQLPYVARSLVNQKSALARLSAMAAADAPAVHCVVGAAGVGKSALVIHWAATHEEEFPDGILFADLRGFHPTGLPAESGEVLDAFLAALGLSEQTADYSLPSRMAAYRTAMHGKRALVVLDDAATDEQVRALLPGGRSAVVVTSRSALHGLVAREGVEVIKLDLLPPHEAVELLRRVAGPELTPSGSQTAELARLCGYQPMALRIAAERLAGGEYADIADLVDELSHGAEVLDLFDTGDPASALRSVFTMSYRHLDDEQALVFRFLGLFAGTAVGVEAASVVSGVSLTATRRALAALRRANLVELDGPGRYRMHDLMRHFAVERVEHEDSAAAKEVAIQALTTWYLAGAANAGDALGATHPAVPRAGGGPEFPTAAAAAKWLRSEHANLVACVRQAAAGGHHTLAWRLSGTLFEHFYRVKSWEDWINTQATGLASARLAGDRRGVACLLGMLGVAHRERRERTRAEECFREALAVWAELGDDGGLAWTASRYAQACREAGKLEDAIRLCHRALEAVRRTGDTREEGIIHNNLSGLHRDAGRIEDALEHSNRALTAFESVGYRRGVAWARTNAANSLRDAGRLADALELYERAHAERSALDDHYGRAVTLSDMGYAQRLSGDVTTGLATLRSSLALFPADDPATGRIRARITEFEQGLRGW